jgi:hypothetical protein
VSKPKAKDRKKQLPPCTSCRRIRVLSASGRCWNCDDRDSRSLLPGMGVSR